MPLAVNEQPLEQEELSLFALENQLRQIVFSSTKLAQLVREAPSIASLLTREQIQLYGWLSTNEVLYRQPGFSPSQDYERRTVNVRGFYEGWNNSHLLLLFDGLPYNEPFSGTAYTDELTPLFMLKSIEILRGPGSALYGSNAVHGVVSLNSLSAKDLPAPAIGMIRIGSMNTQMYDVMAGKEFRYVSFLAAYNYHTTDGNVYLDYDGSGRRDSNGALRQFKINDARSGHFGLLKLEGNGPLEGLSLQTHLFYSANQTGHGWLWYIPDDDSEYVHLERQLVSLRYNPKPWKGKFTPDFAIRYQRRGFDYHNKLYPNNTTFGSGMSALTYPDGLSEYVVTATHDIFLRGQLGWNIRPGMNLTVGAENTLFFYLGDSLHQSNVDLATTALPFNPPGLRNLGPFLPWLGSNPLNNTGIYLQYLSGRVLRDYVSVTAGLRLDIETFLYNDITLPDQPTERRTLFAASPRLAILLFPHPSLTIKLLGNRAFRAPAPSEVGAANTYLVSSNPKIQQPETVSTIELGLDSSIVPHVNLRAAVFYEYLENLIGYAPTSNTLLNLYSRGVVGVEAEALANLPLERVGDFQGFANYSYAYAVQESAAPDSPRSVHPGFLTWAPAHLFNLGLGYTGHGLSLSVQVHYQGAVQRRDSDLATPENAMLRPSSVDAWTTFDAKVAYNPVKWLQLGIQANNLFNQQGYLIKVGNFPFDYRNDGVRILGTLQLQTPAF